MARSAAEAKAWDAAQRDESFRAWVAMTHDVLELEFDEDVPGLPERPWGAPALHIAEAAALEHFASMSECFSERTWDLSWRFVRFLGQVFVEGFGGTWVNLPARGRQRARVAVKVPGSGYVEPIGLLTSAMHRRTGTEWEFVYGNVEHETDQRAADEREQPIRDLTDSERGLLARIVDAAGSAALSAQLEQARVMPAGDCALRFVVAGEPPSADLPDGALPWRAEWKHPELPAWVRVLLVDGRLSRATLRWFLPSEPPRWPPADEVTLEPDVD